MSSRYPNYQQALKDYEKINNNQIKNVFNDKLDNIKLLEQEEYKKAFLEIFNVGSESDSNIPESSPASRSQSPTRL